MCTCVDCVDAANRARLTLGRSGRRPLDASHLDPQAWLARMAVYPPGAIVDPDANPFATALEAAAHPRDVAEALVGRQ